MSEKTLRSFWMEWDTERATEWLRERYLSFRLHHAELQTHATPEEFADLFVEWCASAPGPLGDASSLGEVILGISDMIDGTYPSSLDPEAHLLRRVVKIWLTSAEQTEVYKALIRTMIRMEGRATSGPTIYEVFGAIFEDRFVTRAEAAKQRRAFYDTGVEHGVETAERMQAEAIEAAGLKALTGALDDLADAQQKGEALAVNDPAMWLAHRIDGLRPDPDAIETCEECGRKVNADSDDEAGFAWSEDGQCFFCHVCVAAARARTEGGQE